MNHPDPHQRRRCAQGRGEGEGAGKGGGGREVSRLEKENDERRGVGGRAWSACVSLSLSLSLSLLLSLSPCVRATGLARTLFSPATPRPPRRAATPLTHSPTGTTTRRPPPNAWLDIPRPAVRPVVAGPPWRRSPDRRPTAGGVSVGFFVRASPLAGGRPLTGRTGYIQTSAVWVGTSCSGATAPPGAGGEAGGTGDADGRREGRE